MIKKLLFLFAILPSITFAQHTIKGTFTPANQFKFAFLYRVTAETSLFVNNADVNEDGTFTIDMPENTEPGTYRIVYAQPQDEYNFDFIYNNEDVELAFDLDKGLSFITSKENKLYDSYLKSKALVNKQIRNYYGTKNESEKDFKKIFKILEDTQNEFEKAAEGTMALEFIKALRPYIPSEREDVATFAGHIKSNYFKNIDFGNKTLQNSNFLISNAIKYVAGYVNNNNVDASYIENIDTLVNAIGDNPKVKKVILKILWNQFADVNQTNEAAANHIASNYLLKLLSNSENDREFANQIIAFKNSSIGEVAPDFPVEIKDKDDKVVVTKMSKLDSAEQYLIIFWSTTCSHCLEELPLLKEYTASLPNNKLKVIAVALDDAYYRWSDMRYDYPDFIHVFGEGKWDNEIGNNYNVTATPTYFVLDKNKKIINKPYDFEAFKNYLDKLPNPKKDVLKEEKNKD
ncbi:TlpA family protein disulfide reductase [Lacinutrix salivirga]